MICQGVTKKGNPCTREATHQHETDLGTRVMVCSQHLRVLTRRERGKSDEEVLEGWGVTTPGLTAPGQAGPHE